MKANIHPVWHTDTKVTCSCGNTFITSSTLDKITVEVCAKCHPFYTGQMKLVDTAGRVDAFKERRKKAKKKVISKTQKRKIKKQKRIQKELEKPDTLEELRKRLAQRRVKRTKSKKKN